ncbi:hypoxia up-regulated protein [Anaeramoeba flamelloides]|uniref:Hypoxia up-regulated protein n=1 Tax=Anaeramoeba flamelloides TaxID=1746091 RepID=A0AAV7ZLK6_9EUKA|nr:hypoxia up-regulated protein [Anaeramoeba flamelloides]
MFKSVIKISIIFLSLLTLFTEGAVLGIDFGSESLKVAVKDQGKQLQIVLNSASQRKTRSSIAFVEGERFFGKEAEFVSIKQPEYSLINLKSLIGATNETIFEMPFPISQEMIFDPNDSSLLSLTFNDENNSFGFCKQEKEKENKSETKYIKEEGGEEEEEKEKVRDTQEEKKEEDEEEVNKCKFEFKPEEILVMMLDHIKAMSKDFLQLTDSKKIKDCVLTVPSYYGERERQSILYAAKLANLNVLSLINDHSAFAMKYTMNQLASLKENESHNVILVDIGAGSTIVSLFNVKSITKPAMIKGKTRTSGLITIKGVSWDKELSGENLDKRILEHLLDKFDNENESKFPIGQYERSIRECKYSVNKIQTRVPKWKHILSVNNKAMINIDSLIGGIDWSSEIRRQELEEIGNDLWERISITISRAIERSGLLKEEIDQVELVGGTVRIPIIQREISNYFENKLQLRKNINFDEGAALGAGILAAGLSKQFRVTDIELHEIQMRDIYALYPKFEKQKKNKKNQIIEIKSLIFSQNDALPIRKKLKFTNFPNNWLLKIFEGNSPTKKLFEIHFFDLKKILIDHDFNETANASPLLTISLKINRNGLIRIKDSKLIIVPSNSSVNGRHGNINSEEDGGDHERNANNLKKYNEQKDARYIDLMDILKIKYFGKQKYKHNELKKSKKIIQKFEELDQKNKKKLIIRNELESKIYNLFEKINDQIKEDMIKSSEREDYNKLIITLNNIQKWLYDKGMDKSIKYSEYLKKIKLIDQISKPILNQINEFNE